MIYIYAVDWTRGKGRKWVLLLVVSTRIIFADFSAFWMSDETLLHLAFDKLVKHQLKKLYKLQEIVHIHAHVFPVQALRGVRYGDTPYSNYIVNDNH